MKIEQKELEAVIEGMADIQAATSLIIQMLTVGPNNEGYDEYMQATKRLDETTATLANIFENRMRFRAGLPRRDGKRKGLVATIENLTDETAGPWNDSSWKDVKTH